MEARSLNKRAHNKHGIGAVPFKAPLKLSDIALTDTEK